MIWEFLSRYVVLSTYYDYYDIWIKNLGVLNLSTYVLHLDVEFWCRICLESSVNHGSQDDDQWDKLHMNLGPSEKWDEL